MSKLTLLPVAACKLAISPYQLRRCAEVDMPNSQSTPRKGSTHNVYDTPSNGSISSLDSHSQSFTSFAPTSEPAATHQPSTRASAVQAQALVTQVAVRRTSILSNPRSLGVRPGSMEWEPDVYGATELSSSDEAAVLQAAEAALHAAGASDSDVPLIQVRRCRVLPVLDKVWLVATC